MPAIITVTLNPTIDRSVVLDRMAPEQKLRCSRPRRDPGGGGLNVSRALRNLGHPSLALWTQGGHLGAMLHDLLQKDGVQHQPVPIGGETRENVIAYESDSGQQYRLGMPGPVLQQDEADAVIAALQQQDTPQYLVASGSLPEGVAEDFYARLAQQASRRNVRFVLDCSGPALEKALEEGVFLIKPNLRELRDLTGNHLDEDHEIAAAVHEMVRAGACQWAVVSMGAAGVLAAGADRALRIPSPTVRIRSKIGAGDSTVAGIMAGLVRGWDPLRAIRYGVAAGAAAVMTDGTELCHAEDVERLFKQLEAQSAQQEIQA